VFTTTTTQTTVAGRQTKPRAFAIPVVRPVPPRPAGAGATGTW
jgi:hypothetical protein